MTSHIRKCSQKCGRPAMMRLAGEDLCLACAQSFRQLVDGHANTIAIQYNHLLGMAETSVGIPKGMPRMPVMRPAAATLGAEKTTYKHVDASNADVGAINEDGQIDRIDLTVESFSQRGGDVAELSEPTEKFVNAVIAADELRPEDKSAVTHVVSTLLTQIEIPAPRRMPRSVLESVFETVSPLLRDTSELVSSWKELGPRMAELLALETS